MEPFPTEGEIEPVVVLVAVLISVGVFLVLQGAICFFTARLYRRLPEPFRELSPPAVWLLMIPCFHLIWNFFVFPKLSMSYRKCFEAAGIAEGRSFHEQLAMAYPIAVLVTCVPCGCVSGPAALVALVLVILYLVQMSDLASVLPEGSGDDVRFAPDGFDQPGPPEA